MIESDMTIRVDQPCRRLVPCGLVPERPNRSFARRERYMNEPIKIAEAKAHFCELVARAEAVARAQWDPHYYPYRAGTRR